MTTRLIELDSSLALHALLFDIGWYCFLHNSDVPLVVHATCRPSKCLDIWDFPDDQEIELPLNSMHQPVNDRVRSFTGWLGTIARKPHMCPIRYLNWKEELKEECWHVVEVLKKYNTCNYDILHVCNLLTQVFDCSENTSSLVILLHMRLWRLLPYKKLGRLGGIISVGWKVNIIYRIQETKHGWRTTNPKDAYQKIGMCLLSIGILMMQWYVCLKLLWVK